MMTNDLLKPNERMDDLQCNGFRIIQNPSCFCYGMDAVLLANFARIKPGAKVVDLGTGTGVIPLLLAAKGKGAEFTGLEIQPEMAEMAERSVRLNHISDRMQIVCGDIRQVQEHFPAAAFQAVTSNPPYISQKSGLHNPEAPVNIARHEILLTLEEVIGAAAYLLNQGGTFSMVHKPFRLPEIMNLMVKYRLEPKRMQLVQPHRGKEPNMVLIEAVKGGNPMLKILPTLVVYEADGRYTKELLDYYENRNTLSGSNAHRES
jgi:tRNA1Val (adenine37-N6)-methyltransferase